MCLATQPTDFGDKYVSPSNRNLFETFIFLLRYPYENQTEDSV